MSFTITETLNEEYVEQIKSKYDARFNAVAKVFPNFSDEQAIKLGIMLENTEAAFRKYERMNESTQVASIADGIKNQYFDIITATMPNIIAEDLFSVQPLRQKAGQIFFLDYVYGSNKGHIKKGDTIFGANYVAGYENSTYSSEYVENEVLTSTDGSATQFTGNFQYVPMLPGTISLTIGNVTAEDDGSGNIKGNGVTGTVDYYTGAYTLTFGSAPAEEDIYANYQFDMSYAPSTIPQIDLKIRDVIVQARPRKLRGLYSLDAGYDLQQAQGVDIRDSLLMAASSQLKHEIDGELIQTAYAQASASVTWNDNYNNATAGISKLEYYLDFIDTLVKGASRIRQTTKRVGGNWIVVGKEAGDILEFIGAPRFVSSGQTTQVGPHFAGTLDNKYKIYIDPFLAENQFLIGYKGDTLLDAGLVYAPYLPFFATETVMLDDFLGRRGFASTYGKKMVNADYYVKGVITHQKG